MTEISRRKFIQLTVVGGAVAATGCDARPEPLQPRPLPRRSDRAVRRLRQPRLSLRQPARRPAWTASRSTSRRLARCVRRLRPVRADDGRPGAQDRGQPATTRSAGRRPVRAARRPCSTCTTRTACAGFPHEKRGRRARRPRQDANPPDGERRGVLARRPIGTRVCKSRVGAARAPGRSPFLPIRSSSADSPTLCAWLDEFAAGRRRDRQLLFPAG